MKRILILGALLAAVSLLSAQAQEARFTEVSGKVEFQIPGGSWQPARVGSPVAKGSLVSTGFKSTAVLLLGTSQITLKPLTRMALDSLVKTEGGTQTKLHLLSGRVKADVPPQAGQTTEFSVRSPTATASVRGTSFEFDGINLIVDRGVVNLSGAYGQLRQVQRGEFAYVDDKSLPTTPVAVASGQGLDQIAVLVDLSSAENTPIVNAPLGSDVSPAPLSASLAVRLQ